LPSSPATALRAVVGVGVVLVVARSPGGRLLLLLAEEETIEALRAHDMEREYKLNTFLSLSSSTGARGTSRGVVYRSAPIP